jgi:hypothetical protein
VALVHRATVSFAFGVEILVARGSSDASWAWPFTERSWPVVRRPSRRIELTTSEAASTLRVDRGVIQLEMVIEA